NLGVIPRSSPVYSEFKSWAVPMFIVLMLLDIDIRATLKVAWRGIGVLVWGALGIVAGAAVAFSRSTTPPSEAQIGLNMIKKAVTMFG
ncbi:MAG: DUF819 family protein, partial [Acidobacteriota bacterium]